MRIYLLLVIFYYTIILIRAASNEPEVDIKDAGVGFINEGDIALMFYITLENKCTEEFEICASMMQCCETTKQRESDCSSMYLIGGNMGVLYSKKIKNITLIYPNLYLRNRQGMCTVEVKYQNENIAKEITAEIEFKTSKNCDSEQQQCSTVDLDPLQNCNQVDCVIKYSGETSYFNPKCKECVCVPICMSDPEKCVPQVVYSIATNNCTSLGAGITKNDLQTLEHEIDQNQSSEDTGECGASVLRNIVCHHGNLDSSGKCKCNSDWVTTTDDEVYQPSLLLYHMCNIEVGAWNCVNKGKIKTTALLITIFALTIASKILILMCILNWCYKRFKSKRTCAPNVDPFDESLILCDTIESFEQCLCEQLGGKKHDKKQHDKLKKETVNVSYYPCSPSGFSSVCPSTGSEKDKYSGKTVPLSNTTSSSVPVSFESETDPTTDSVEEDEDEDEDEDYDIEFIGEGEEEEDEDDCICDGDETDKDGPKTTSGEAQGEEQTEYSVSVVEGSEKASTSTKSKSLSAKTKSSKKSKP